MAVRHQRFEGATTAGEMQTYKHVLLCLWARQRLCEAALGTLGSCQGSVRCVLGRGGCFSFLPWVC